jgi:predicted metalloprotease
MTGTAGRTARPVLGAVVGVLAAVLVVGMVYLGVSTYTLVNAMRETQQTNSKTYDKVLDCTDPEGECYREGQERTKQVVADIGKVSAYAAACADLPGRQTEVEVYQCVLDRLAEEAPPAK